jgi:hypothetical protein
MLSNFLIAALHVMQKIPQVHVNCPVAGLSATVYSLLNIPHFFDLLSVFKFRFPEHEGLSRFQKKKSFFQTKCPIAYVTNSYFHIFMQVFIWLYFLSGTFALSVFYNLGSWVGKWGDGWLSGEMGG